MLKRALKKEWLYVLGTSMILLQWAVDKFFIQKEESYMQFFRDQSNEFYARLDEHRLTTIRYNLLTLNQDKFKSEHERRGNLLIAKIENAQAMNQALLALKTRGIQSPEEEIIKKHGQILSELDGCAYRLDSVRAGEIYDSLQRQFTNRNTFENVRVVEFEAMESHSTRIRTLDLYNYLRDAFLIFGTIFISINTLRKYLRKVEDEERPVELGKLNHTLSEVKKSTERIETHIKQKIKPSR